jgi:radical SAM superfamily enzyme YgiQ (UPF0313 family)
VAGGPHATHLARPLLTRHAALDAVALGEGEETMLEVANAVRDGASWRAISGLAWRGEGGIVFTPPRAPLSNLDGIPHPSTHYVSTGVDRIAQFEFLITSRGCPARCTFCSTPEFWGTRLRFRSADHVLDELRHLQARHGLVTVSFRDDTFTVDKKRTLDLCRKILASDLHLLWDCQSRVNAVDEERLLWMRRAGCQHIQYGVESGSRAVLERLNKGIALAQIEQACRLTRRVGMDLSVYLITGVHGETELDVQQTLRLIRRIRPHDGIVSPLVVYPGTALYEEAKRLKGVDDSIWERSGIEGLLVRDDLESVLAYRRVDAVLKEVAAASVYSCQERMTHKERIGPFVAPLLSLGETLESEGRSAQAEEQYREILASRPDSLWAHLRLGNLKERNDDPSSAATHYRRAIAAVPRYHLGYSLLGSALRRMGKRSEALAAFRTALRLYPVDRVALRGVSLLHRPAQGRDGRIESYSRKPNTGLTGSSQWPPFLKHPIPDGHAGRFARSTDKACDGTPAK